MKSRVHFYVSEGFSLLALTSAITVLKTANRILQMDAYRWLLLSQDGGDVVSDCGVELQTEPFDAIAPCEWSEALIALVVGSHSKTSSSQKIVAWLRKAVAQGAELAGIGHGALWMAELGLLRGKRCAVHWELVPAMSERFFDVNVTRAYYCTEGSLHTCAGETAASDFFLHKVGSDFDLALLDQVSEATLHAGPRGKADQQPMPREWRLRQISSPLVPLVAYMEQNIANPVTMKDLATLAGLSRRQVERVFMQDLREPPMRYYTRLRMERAGTLLLNTSLPILEVAIAVGYGSHSHFTKLCKKFYGRTPAQIRASAAAEMRKLGQPRSVSIRLAA